MTTPYVGNAANGNANSIELAVASDPRTTTIDNAAKQQIWDSIKALREGRIDSASVEQFHAIRHFDPTDWHFANPGGGKVRVIQDDIGGGHTPVFVPLRLPVGATLTEVRVYMVPDAGHGSLPASRPSFLVRESGPWAALPSAVVVATQTDGASLGVYNGYHSFFDTVSVPVQSGFEYELAILGESGANSIAGLELWGVRTLCTVTRIDPRGGSGGG